MVLRRLENLFDPRRELGDGLLDLILSDYLAYYVATPQRERWGVSGSSRSASPRRLALLFFPRLAHNPSLHAMLMIRLAIAGPQVFIGLWRTILIAKHGIDIQSGMKIGAGLLLPHPVGIVFGAGLEVGRDVTVLQQVTIGGAVGRRSDDGQMCPRIGDDVVIFMGSMLVGPIEVGARAVVGAGAWVEHDVPAGGLHRGRAAVHQKVRDSHA